ncbi:hypothetical protein NDU88_001892 [Pleurodeles waltl]|uniref:Uncharacterized protein n=1 Tax=Pleurodeles waltl TaxID=8319 RepID=A0AAV7T108_PLEWA|nr:hypothetical protein NDU88_001892 [Pleurodeles waltl]
MVSAELSLLRTDHWKLVERVDNAGEELNEMGTSHRVQQTQLTHPIDRVQRLEHRAKGAEGRSRRNTIRIVGLSEADYTAAVQAKRASYTEVKKALRTAGIRYALLFPSKLKIMWDGHTHFCLCPEETWSWLETYRTGKDDQNLREPPPARRRKKRSCSGDRPLRDKVLGTTKTQASQGK